MEINFVDIESVILAPPLEELYICNSHFNWRTGADICYESLYISISLSLTIVLWLTQDESLVTQDDPRVTQDDPRVTQDDPLEHLKLFNPSELFQGC